MAASTETQHQHRSFQVSSSPHVRKSGVEAAEPPLKTQPPKLDVHWSAQMRWLVTGNAPGMCTKHVASRGALQRNDSMFSARVQHAAQGVRLEKNGRVLARRYQSCSAKLELPLLEM